MGRFFMMTYEDHLCIMSCERHVIVEDIMEDQREQLARLYKEWLLQIYKGSNKSKFFDAEYELGCLILRNAFRTVRDQVSVIDSKSFLLSPLEDDPTLIELINSEGYAWFEVPQRFREELLYTSKEHYRDFIRSLLFDSHSSGQWGYW